jgi:hypothetical protein
MERLDMTFERGTMTDEILKEIHAIKDANARKYAAGFTAMMDDLRKRQEQSGRKIIRTSLHPRRAFKCARRVVSVA